MGRAKPALELGGRTLLDRCLDALRPIASPVIVVGGSPTEMDFGEYRAVADDYPGAGPVGGIVTALRALGEGNHIIVACDMPFLQASLLRLLAQAANENFDAVVPWPDSGPEPLCAVYRQTSLPLLEAFLATGRRSARQALQSLRVRQIPEPELREADPELVSFVNLNTPEDLERYASAQP